MCVGCEGLYEWVLAVLLTVAVMWGLYAAGALDRWLPPALDAATPDPFRLT